jgi:hypothetical protein
LPPGGTGRSLIAIWKNFMLRAADGKNSRSTSARGPLTLASYAANITATRPEAQNRLRFHSALHYISVAGQAAHRSQSLVRRELCLVA